MRIALFIFLVMAPFRAEASPPPPLNEVIEAARAAQGLSGALDPWSQRARWRAVMPRLGGWVGGARVDELDLTFRESAGVIDEGVLILDGTQNTTEDDTSEKIAWRVTATWDLRDLVFTTPELAAAREARGRQATRIRLDLRVLALYRQLKGPDVEARAAHEELDLLTDGWWSRRVKR